MPSISKFCLISIGLLFSSLSGHATATYTEADIELTQEYYDLRDRLSEKPQVPIDSFVEKVRAHPKKGVRALADLAEGYHHRVNRRLDKALSSYKSALTKEPNLWRAHYELGWLYRDLAKVDLAHKHADLFLKNCNEANHGPLPDRSGADVNAYLLKAQLAMCYRDHETTKRAIAQAVLRDKEKKYTETTDYFRIAQRVMTIGPKGWSFGDKGTAQKYESSNYVIMTDVGKDFAKDLARRCEALLALYQKEFKFLGDMPEDVKSTVLVFDNKQDYLEFNMALRGHNMEHAAGYFDTRSKFLVLYNDQTKSYSLTVTGKDFPEVFKTLYHELFHQYLDHFVGTVPMWINEGLASMYENVRVKGRKAKMPSTCQYHLEIVRDAAQAGELDRIEDIIDLELGGQSSYTYWCIMQFYFHKKVKKLHEKLIKALQAGIHDNERLKEIVLKATKKRGDKLHKVWLDHCRKLRRGS